MQPLSDRVRPTTLEEVAGQRHILGQNKPLFNLIKNKIVTNMIFYGPPGTGKTTVANIIARQTDKKMYKLNATNASVKDIQDIVKNINNLVNYKGILLYLDEIQNFNSKQQQSLLEYIEDGRITLIASTAENPYFSIYKAILSRSIIFQFKPLTKDDIAERLGVIINTVLNEEIKIKCEEHVFEYIADICQGDLRKAINILEFAILSKNSNEFTLSVNDIEELGQSNIRFDISGDENYNLLSALQKSIRGSDADASVHYLARLIKGSNMDAIVRRISVICAEDIGLAHPNALAVVNSGLELALKVGFPEASIILSEIVIYLATLPKSNSACCAIMDALHDLDIKNVGDIPNHIKDAHYSGAEKLGVSGYKYPHDYPNNYVRQQYLPDNIRDKVYYNAQNNKYEQSIKAFWDRIKNL